MECTKQILSSPQPQPSTSQRHFIPDTQNGALDSQEVPANYAFTQTDESNNTELNDEFILTALQNPRDRITLLKLEHDLEKFIKDPTETRLSFPPMSSYQRLIVHRVAQYFSLEHTALDIYPQQRTVVLLKTPETKLPPVLFRDMNVNKEQDSTQTQRSTPKAIKIMQRRPAREESPPVVKEVTRTEPLLTKIVEKPQEDKARALSTKTLEEREQEYAKARARIFSNESKTSQENSNQQDGTSNIAERSMEREIEQVPQQPQIQTQTALQTQPIQTQQIQQIQQTLPSQSRPNIATKQKLKQNKEVNTNGMDVKSVSSAGDNGNGWEDSATHIPRSNPKPFWSNGTENDYNDYNDFYSYDMTPMYVNSGYGYPTDNQEISWAYTEPPYAKASAPPQNKPAPMFAQPFPRKSHSFNLGSNNYNMNNVHNFEPQPTIHPKSGPPSRQWNNPNYSLPGGREDTRVISPPLSGDIHGKPNIRKTPDVQFLPQQPMGHISPPPTMSNYSSYEPTYHPAPPHPQAYNSDPTWFPPLYNPGYPLRTGSQPPPQQLPQQPPQPRQAPPMMNNPYPYTSYSVMTQIPTVPTPQGPPIAYDYERRPPKSTELFDPKAQSEGITKKMAQMNVSTPMDRGGGGRGRGRGGPQQQYYYSNNANAYPSWPSPQVRDRNI